MPRITSKQAYYKLPPPPRAPVRAREQGRQMRLSTAREAWIKARRATLGDACIVAKMRKKAKNLV